MLKEISVKNFRNLKFEEQGFRPGVTILFGENGQGKTNVLEAIHFLSYGKSFRGPSAQAINWRVDEARIYGETDAAKLGIIIRRDKENEFSVNGKTKKLSALLGRFVSVFFHPQEIELVFGPPTLRRSWLDRLISTVDKNYLYALINYQKALQNKNKLLKSRVFEPIEMEVWNKTLTTYGTKIWQVRESTV